MAGSAADSPQRSLLLAAAVLMAAGPAAAAAIDTAACAVCDRFVPLMGDLAKDRFPGDVANHDADRELCQRLPADMREACGNVVHLYGLAAVDKLAPGAMCEQLAACHDAGDVLIQMADLEWLRGEEKENDADRAVVGRGEEEDEEEEDDDDVDTDITDGTGDFLLSYQPFFDQFDPDYDDASSDAFNAQVDAGDQDLDNVSFLSTMIAKTGQAAALARADADAAAGRKAAAEAAAQASGNADDDASDAPAKSVYDEDDEDDVAEEEKTKGDLGVLQNALALVSQSKASAHAKAHAKAKAHAAASKTTKTVSASDGTANDMTDFEKLSEAQTSMAAMSSPFFEMGNPIGRALGRIDPNNDSRCGGSGCNRPDDQSIEATNNGAMGGPDPVLQMIPAMFMDRDPEAIRERPAILTAFLGGL